PRRCRACPGAPPASLPAGACPVLRPEHRTAHTPPDRERCTATRRRGAQEARRPRAGSWWEIRGAGAPPVRGPRLALPAPARQALRGPWNTLPAGASFWHVSFAIWFPGRRSCCAEGFLAV